MQQLFSLLEALKQYSHMQVHGNHNTIALGGQDATAKSTVIIKGKNPPGCGCCEHAACACCSVSMPEVVAVEQDSEQARGPATKTSTHMGLKGKKNVPFKPENFPVHPNLHLSASFSKTHGYAKVVAKHRRFELRMALRKRQFKAQKQQFKAHLAGTRRESASASKKNSKKNEIALSLNRKNQLKRGSAGVSRGMHPAANAAHAQEVQPPAERPRRYSFYLLYYYKCTNTDTCGASCQEASASRATSGRRSHRRYSVYLLYTNTKVLKLLVFLVQMQKY